MLEKSADDVINENNEEHFQNAEYDYQRKVRSNDLLRAFFSRRHILIRSIFRNQMLYQQIVRL